MGSDHSGFAPVVVEQVSVLVDGPPLNHLPVDHRLKLGVEGWRRRDEGWWPAGRSTSGVLAAALASQLSAAWCAGFAAACQCEGGGAGIGASRLGMGTEREWQGRPAKQPWRAGHPIAGHRHAAQLCWAELGPGKACSGPGVRRSVGGARYVDSGARRPWLPAPAGKGLAVPYGSCRSDQRPAKEVNR